LFSLGSVVLPGCLLYFGSRLILRKTNLTEFAAFFLLVMLSPNSSASSRGVCWIPCREVWCVLVDCRVVFLILRRLVVSEFVGPVLFFIFRLVRRAMFFLLEGLEWGGVTIPDSGSVGWRYVPVSVAARAMVVRRVMSVALFWDSCSKVSLGRCCCCCCCCDGGGGSC